MAFFDPFKRATPPAPPDEFGYSDPMEGLGPIDKYKYLNKNQPEALMALGAGIMRDDWAGGFENMGGAMAQNRLYNQKRADIMQTRNATKQWLINQGLSEEDANAAMLNPDILKAMLKKQGLSGEGDQNAFAPVLMKDKDGNFFYASPDPNTGQLDPYTMPEGAVPVDPGTKAGLVEGAKVIAKGSAEARLLLVDAKLQQQDVRTMSRSVLSDPYLDKMFGEIDMTGGWYSKADLPNISPDSSRVMGKLKRLMGQSFMQARQLLKGGGQITDYEGTKADEAYSTIAYAKTVPDLKAAIQEFQYWVDRGVQKLQQTANVENTPETGEVPVEPAVAPPSLNPPATGGGGGGWTVEEQP